MLNTSTIPATLPITDTGTSPGPAGLDNPFYYLENALTVIRWCQDRHADLLTQEELEQLETLQRLERPAQALLIRMVMRSGRYFFTHQLTHYEEIGQAIPALLDQLAQSKLIDLAPNISAPDLANLLKKPQLSQLYNALSEQPLPKSSSKERLTRALIELNPDAAALQNWLHSLNDPLIELSCDALFTRLRLMFFGNLRQSWSEFVITELGYFQFEPVELSPDSRAFQTRTEVDLYLQLDAVQQNLESDTDLEALFHHCESLEAPTAWLSGRKGGVLHRIARQAEREQAFDLARRAYEQAGHSESRIRRLRLAEKQETSDQLAALCDRLQATFHRPIDQLHFSRIQHRAARKQGASSEIMPLQAPPIIELSLPKTDQRVEYAVVAHYSTPDQPCFYVENTLINGLFGLLFWPAIFAPVPGAFFNPFQSGPADLFRSRFRALREPLIQRQLDLLYTGEYADFIRTIYRTKRGITQSLIHWPALSDELLELALTQIPAAHMALIFERLLSDIRTHRSGFPDLIRFDTTAGHYQLIEVKGPGDRLQDNQRLWLAYFCTHQIPCEVCWVSWQDE